MESARESWSEYWYPPTAEQLLRRARNRIVTKGNQIERRLQSVEREEAQAMKRLTDAACSSEENELRSIAREVARKRGMAAKLRDARRMTTTAEGRITMTESSAAVRAAMRDATHALGIAVEGGPAGWNAEAQDMMRNVHAAEMMEQTMDDAMADEREEFEADETVETLILRAQDSVLSSLPRPPDGPPLLDGIMNGLIGRVDALSTKDD